MGLNGTVSTGLRYHGIARDSISRDAKALLALETRSLPTKKKWHKEIDEILPKRNFQETETDTSESSINSKIVWCFFNSEFVAPDTTRIGLSHCAQTCRTVYSTLCRPLFCWFALSGCGKHRY